MLGSIPPRQGIGLLFERCLWVLNQLLCQKNAISGLKMLPRVSVCSVPAEFLSQPSEMCLETRRRHNTDGKGACWEAGKCCRKLLWVAYRFLILPAFLGSVLSKTACSVRGGMGSCFKTGVPMWRNNKKPAFSSKNASVHSCKVLLHHCQAGNLRGAAPKHLRADRSKFPLEGCSAVRKGMRCCGRNTACAPALCQQMESILP